VLGALAIYFLIANFLYYVRLSAKHYENWAAVLQ